MCSGTAAIDGALAAFSKICGSRGEEEADPKRGTLDEPRFSGFFPKGRVRLPYFPNEIARVSQRAVVTHLNGQQASKQNRTEQNRTEHVVFRDSSVVVDPAKRAIQPSRI